MYEICLTSVRPSAAGEERAFGMSCMGLRHLSLDSGPLESPPDLRCCTGLRSLALTLRSVGFSHPFPNPSLSLTARHTLPAVRAHIIEHMHKP